MRTIAMFLDSYPSEEKEIDSRLFAQKGREEEDRTVIHLYPEWKWEGENTLSKRDAEVN